MRTRLFSIDPQYDPPRRYAACRIYPPYGLAFYSPGWRIIDYTYQSYMWFAGSGLAQQRLFQLLNFLIEQNRVCSLNQIRAGVPGLGRRASDAVIRNTVRDMRCQLAETHIQIVTHRGRGYEVICREHRVMRTLAASNMNAAVYSQAV